MAKATAICTCKTCGSSFEKTTTKRNRAECNDWEQWAVEHFDECPACYGKRMREEERSTPVYAELSVTPYTEEFHIVLRGNTYPFKDTAKQMGFRWTEEPASGAFGFLTMKAPRKTWVLTCKAEALEENLQKVVAHGLEIENKISGLDVAYLGYCKKA